MKIQFARLLFCLIFFSAALPAVAAPISNEPPAKSARVVELERRLEELRAIDRSTLTRKERKALRHEVREIKKELQGISGGVYLSVGAIILIALLLILLL